jgi:hypothetical protein
MKPQTRQKAIAIVTMLFFLCSSSLVANVFMQRANWHIRNTVHSSLQHRQAYWLAESALEVAQYRRDNNLITTEADRLFTAQMPDGSEYAFWMDAIDPTRIVAIGDASPAYNLLAKLQGAAINSVTDIQALLPGSRSRVLSQHLFITPGGPSLFTGVGAAGTMTLSGSAAIDSFDSRNGSYGGANIGSEAPVFANADINLAGGMGKIHGTASATGSIILPDWAQYVAPDTWVTGEKNGGTDPTQLLPKSVPDDLASKSSSGSLILNNIASQTLGSGDYRFNNLKLSSASNLSIGAGSRIFVDGDLIINDNSVMDLLGEVTFYVSGSVQVNNSARVNNGELSGRTNPASTDLTIICTGNAPVKFTGAGGHRFIGAVYAPNSEVRVEGSSEIFGTIVGNNVTIDGNTRIHFDAALASGGSSGGSGTTQLIQRELRI